MVVCALAAGTLVVSALCAPIVVPLAMGEAFATAAPLVPLALGYAMLGAATSVAATSMQARGQSGRCAMLRWLAATLTLPTIWVGGVIGGVPGVLVGSMLIEGATLAVMLMGPRGRTASTPSSSTPAAQALPRRFHSATARRLAGGDGPRMGTIRPGHYPLACLRIKRTS